MRGLNSEVATADKKIDRGSSQGANPDARRALVATGAVALALLVLVYAPILRFLVEHWKIDPDYSHGYLVVPLSVFFAYARKQELARAHIEGSWLGLVPLVLGALALTVGRLGVELMSMRVGFILSLIGVVLLVYGREVFRILAFPLLFLFLMVPLPNALLNIVAFPLQLVAARFAVSTLHQLGVPALLEGNIIHLANAELFVAEACSGLRSLMALVFLGVVFAYFFRRSAIERIVLVASAIPIAIFVNAMRVTLTGLLAHWFGEQAATGFIHDFQGVITFGLAFLLLLAEARLIAALRDGRTPPLQSSPPKAGVA